MTVSDVTDWLTRTYPAQPGPPWIDSSTDTHLYLDVDVFEEDDFFEPAEWTEMVAWTGGRRPVSVTARVSGRFPGDDEVREFLFALLARFDGVAQDDYTEHLWTAAEIAEGRLVQGHRFFDYRGWYEEGHPKAGAD